MSFDPQMGRLFAMENNNHDLLSQLAGRQQADETREARGLSLTCVPLAARDLKILFSSIQ